MYSLIFTTEAVREYNALTGKLKLQVDKALDRISRHPQFGKPLGGELKGLRSERVSSFRIIYRTYETSLEVLILVIEHRRHVYGGH